MKDSPFDRQKKITNLVRERGQVSLAEISEMFGISAMTAHRDVQQLTQAGTIKRIRGGVARPGPVHARDTCVMCSRPVPDRTAFLLRSPNEEIMAACCAHCGLGHLEHSGAETSALATDFLNGTVVAASRAAYLIGSRVKLCCSPSVLTFESFDDAHRFALGFGGEVMDLTGARQFIRDSMQMS